MARKFVYRDGKRLAVGAAYWYDRMNVAFRKKFKRAGYRLRVTSGFRTRAEQEHLYRLYKAGKGNLAAYPGTSRHERGEAVDVGDSGPRPGVSVANNARSNWVRGNAHKFKFSPNGYGFGEPWHIELTVDPWTDYYRQGLAPDIGYTFANVKGGGGPKDEKTFPLRAGVLAGELTRSKMAVAMGVELPVQLRPIMDKAMRARGYRRLSYGRSSFSYVRRDLFRAGKVKKLGMWTAVLKTQNKGRKEVAHMVAHTFGKRRFAFLVIHLDVYADDAQRVRAMKEALALFRKFCRKHRVPWPNRVIGMDHNTKSGAVVAMLRKRGWRVLVQSKRCAVARRKSRRHWARWKRATAATDHPILSARLGRKA